MAYGRIRRSRAKIKRAAERHFARGGPGKRIGAEVRVMRLPSYRGGGWQYGARACLRTVGHRSAPYGGTASCGLLTFGRTPQSAVAKAFKDLGRQIALRGRRLRIVPSHGRRPT